MPPHVRDQIAGKNPGRIRPWREFQLLPVLAGIGVRAETYRDDTVHVLVAMVIVSAFVLACWKVARPLVAPSRQANSRGAAAGGRPNFGPLGSARLRVNPRSWRLIVVAGRRKRTTDAQARYLRHLGYQGRISWFSVAASDQIDQAIKRTGGSPSKWKPVDPRSTRLRWNAPILRRMR